MKWIVLLMLGGCTTMTKQVVVEWRTGDISSVHKEGVICVITSPKKETYESFGNKLIECLKQGD